MKPQDLSLRPFARAMMVMAGTMLGGSAHASSVFSVDPTLTPESGSYVRTDSGSDCFPSQGVCLLPGAPSGLETDFSMFGAGGQTIVMSVHYTFVVTDLSFSPIGTFFVFGTLAQTVPGRAKATDTGSWDTKITWLKLNGEFINGKPVRVTLNPNTPSTGHAEITAAPGGYLVDNAFDVHATLAVGRLTPIRVNLGAAHVELQPAPAAVTPVALQAR